MLILLDSHVPISSEDVDIEDKVLVHLLIKLATSDLISLRVDSDLILGGLLCNRLVIPSDGFGNVPLTALDLVLSV